MNSKLLNCWEIMGCGRDSKSVCQSNLIECIASKNSMGHSCWAVAGSMNWDSPLCPQVKEKGIKCSFCEVYGLYGRSLGSKAKEVKNHFPEEEDAYIKLVLDRLKTGE